MKYNKKGYNLKDVMPIALMIVVTVIAISIGAQVVSDVASGQCESGYSWNEGTDQCLNSTGGFASGAGMSASANVSGYGLLGLVELGSWLPTIALVIAAAIVIGVLIYSFAVRT